jgi:hypothetical protein
MLLTERKKCRKVEMQKKEKERENKKWKNNQTDTAEERIKNYTTMPKIRRNLLRPSSG